MPPCVLMSKRAEAMYAAIHRRLPISLATLRQRCSSLAVIVLTDSARACIRLSRCFRAQTAMEVGGNGVVSLWAPCLMHRAALVVFAVLKMFSLMVPLYSGTVLLHQASTFELMLRRCRQHIAEELQTVFCKPPGHDVAEAYLNRLLQTLEYSGEGKDDTHNGGRQAPQSRHAARQWLSKALAASAFDDNGRLQTLRHWCALGCCASREETVSKVQHKFEAAVWWRVPAEPACNRWTKMFPPLAFWNVADKLGFPAAAVNAVGEPALNVDVPIDDIDTIGPGDDLSYDRKKKARFKKTVTWLASPFTSLYLTVAVVTLEPLLDLLATFFEEARFQNSEKYGAMAFCVQQRSPAIQCISRILARLRAPNHDAWALLRGTGGFGGDGDKVTLAFIAGVTACANLWQRCVRPYMVWPWLLANIVAPEVPTATKREIADRLAAAEPCCYECGFTAHVRKLAPTADQLVSSGVAQQLIRNTLGRVSSNNIANEDRFARMRNHSRSCSGNVMTPEAMASNHMLAELKAWHWVAVDRIARARDVHGFMMPRRFQLPLKFLYPVISLLVLVILRQAQDTTSA